VVKGHQFRNLKCSLQQQAVLVHAHDVIIHPAEHSTRRCK
jgi:hypothetical protein